MFKTAWQYIKRSPYQSAAAILIMTLAFFIIGVFMVVAVGGETILRFLETRPQITAFLKEEVKPQQVELLKSKLETTGKILKVRFVSKEEALNIYKEENKNNPLLLEMVTAKILPASLEVSAINLAALPEIAKTLKAEPIVEEVIFQEDVVSVLSNWLQTLRLAGAFLVGFLILISVLTVLIVIGMKISAKKEEIEILALVGANKWYIRWPFIIEGVIYGLASGFISWLSSYLLLLYSTPFLVAFLAGIPLFPVAWQFIISLLAGLLLLGLLVGGMGSFMATKRFLKAVK